MVPTKRIEKMEENRRRLIVSARKTFAERGFAAASMDEMTAGAGLTRGALYHNFGDKRGLFAAVVAQVDGEMAARAQEIGGRENSQWKSLLAVGDAYIRMALEPEIRQIVLLDGPAVLGDPAHWPSQNACLDITRQAVRELIDDRIIKPVDIEAASRLLNGLALNAALWIAASDEPETVLPDAIDVFHRLCEGLLADNSAT